MLEESGCQVFLVNMLDYVLMTKPLALSDFILSLMAALASEVEKSSDKDLNPETPGRSSHPISPGGAGVCCCAVSKDQGNCQ